LKQTLTDRVEFFLKFVMRPEKIGSITPSSSYLTRRMLDDLPWAKMRTIVELGAGTGVFTRHIALHCQEGSNVVIFEQDPEMRRALKHRHPDFHYAAKAETLGKVMQSFSLPQADCIISGLPFAVFPDDLRQKIIAGVCENLASGGVFVAFQYSPLLYRLFRDYFSRVEFGFVLLNMPPAFIYTCKK
jgi:phospholipid N-methyltransferase